MTSVVTEPIRQCRRDNPSHLRPLCSNALVSRIFMHGAQVATVARFAARLMKIVGRDQLPPASRTKFIFEQGQPLLGWHWRIVPWRMISSGGFARSNLTCAVPT
jgi:hypothetical protein